MHYILGRFKVADVGVWQEMIRSHRDEHVKAGLHFEKLWSNVDDPSEIYFTFRVDDLERAKRFLDTAGALDGDKQARGEIPRLTFLHAR